MKLLYLFQGKSRFDLSNKPKRPRMNATATGIDWLI